MKIFELVKLIRDVQKENPLWYECCEKIIEKIKDWNKI